MKHIHNHHTCHGKGHSKVERSIETVEVISRFRDQLLIGCDNILNSLEVITAVTYIKLIVTLIDDNEGRDLQGHQQRYTTTEVIFKHIQLII